MPEAREDGIEGGRGMFVRAVMREVNVRVAGLRTIDLSYFAQARVCVSEPRFHDSQQFGKIDEE